MTRGCLRRGLGLQDGPGPAPGFPAVPRLGKRGCHPVPAGQAKAEQTGPGPSSKNRLTGQPRPAPLRVADGDGMDWRQLRADAPKSPPREFV